MVNDLLEIKLFYSDYKGSLSNEFIFSYIPGHGTKDGINFIIIKTKKGKVFEKELLISYKYFINHIEKIFHNYKNRGIKTKINIINHN